MDKRNLVLHLRKKASRLFLFMLLCFHLATVQCQGLMMIQHISTEPPSPSRAPQVKNGFRRLILSIFFGVLTGLIGAILLACVTRLFVQYVNKTPILKGPVIFSPIIAARSLQSALANENQLHLLGSSPNGKYYRTVLDDGLTVAVKMLEPFENASPEPRSKPFRRRIQHELEMLAGLTHRNLMSLRAYIRDPDRLSLVYDYMPNGSLEDALNRVGENQLQLNWEIRLRIAVGVIKGLRYLHFECIPQTFHYDLKPRNVMLDADFEPKLADCGLAKLLPNWDRAVSGYNPPECFQNCSRYTDKSDVFSFGVILGVLLTGRDPMDPFFGEASDRGSLGRWLRHLQQAGEAKEALDKSILGDEVEEDEMLMTVRIAAVCLSDLPADRPSSDELVPMLTQLHSF